MLNLNIAIRRPRATDSLRRSYIEIFRYFSRTRPSRPKGVGTCRHQQFAQSKFCSRSVTSESISELPSSSKSFGQNFKLCPATHKIQDLNSALIGQTVTLNGYIGSRSDISKKLSFINLLDASLEHAVQIVSVSSGAADGVHEILKKIEEHTPVTLTGRVKARKVAKSLSMNGITRVNDVELEPETVQPLNSVPRDMALLLANEASTPELRHLTLRSDVRLRQALKFRSDVVNTSREMLRSLDFLELETPILFKSTPEGAREFIVPTRTPGMAYALPQSPQQYKQILMASGIPRYYQLARCFRDEDLRADRQPEFTQLDLEMAFSSGNDVMGCVESVVKMLWTTLLKEDVPKTFPRMPYADAMSLYGVDKPDRRFGLEICRIDHMLPGDLVSKIGPLTDPAVDVLKFDFTSDPRECQKFVHDFMSSKEAADAGVNTNPDGHPGIFIVDNSKPLNGLQAFGFKAAEELTDLLRLQNGALVILQARSKSPFSGSSTALGKIRLALHKRAVARGYVAAPSGFDFLWVTEFPMFKPNDDEPGQSGTAGLSSTHHPFTAPHSLVDLELLATDPTAAKSEHYDLVVNGVELGGGSRRIHDAALQEYVMRDVLKMPDRRVADFDHLLRVLRTGCPPHAGIALGFDRLVAVMLGRSSIKDVIAFPKNSRGEDLLVRSPSMITDEQMLTYHLQRRMDGKTQE